MMYLFQIMNDIKISSDEIFFKKKNKKITIEGNLKTNEISFDDEI